MLSCKRRLTSSLCATLLLLVTSAFAAEKPCTLHDGDKYYDLNPLKANKDYELEAGGHMFYLNVCRGVATDPWNTHVDEKDGDIAGLVRRDHGDFAIGLVNATLEMKAGDLLLRQSNGSPCTGTGTDDVPVRGSSVIRFLCDTSIYAAGKPVLLDQWPSDDDKACDYEFEWRTHYACPTGEHGFFGGVFVFFVITAMIFLMAFIVISTLYNRFVLRLNGYDQMPKFTISHAHEILDVCADFCRSAMDHISARLSSWRNRGHADVRSTSHHWTSREEEEAMIASDPVELESEDVHDDAGRELHDTSTWGRSRQVGEEGGERGIIRM
ncbi:mannose-6-phosphate receptor binding domain-containing protein [Melanogaster broomeanus]|nr:mannose-6-phosphate receptor binding domain-containing protein [Melanogaster broomeanus]